MECYNKCYLPEPPRDWSRVQDSCSLTTDIGNNGFVTLPLTGEVVPASFLAERMAMLNKGNVLQYKANSSNLTKAQRYSKIAKGQWINRNTTWATQSTRGYTNPNNNSLKRAGNVVNIAIDPNTGTIIGETDAPITCPQDINPDPIVIPDGGVLICSVQENPCTGLTKQSVAQQLCNPTSDSDVPGTIQPLCWNDGIQTWYPRQRFQMSNSGNKWPVNAQLSSAIRPSAPLITSITSYENIITLNWIQSDKCLPVSRFDIYQDGRIITSVSKSVNTTSFTVNNCNTYSYFIIGVTNGSNIASYPSNTVSINISYIQPPTITGSLQTVNETTASILLEFYFNDNSSCVSLSGYNIYYSIDGINFLFYGRTSNVSSYIINVQSNQNYTIYAESISNTNKVSIPSNYITVSTLYQPFSTSVETTSVSYDTTNKLWTINISNPTIITFIQDINSTIYVNNNGTINSFNYILNGDVINIDTTNNLLVSSFNTLETKQSSFAVNNIIENASNNVIMYFTYP